MNAISNIDNIEKILVSTLFLLKFIGVSLVFSLSIERKVDFRYRELKNNPIHSLFYKQIVAGMSELNKYIEKQVKKVYLS